MAVSRSGAAPRAYYHRGQSTVAMALIIVIIIAFVVFSDLAVEEAEKLFICPPPHLASLMAGSLVGEAPMDALIDTALQRMQTATQSGARCELGAALCTRTTAPVRRSRNSGERSRRTRR